MLFPSKLFSYNESVISKLIFILRYYDKNQISVHNLYMQVEKHFSNIDEFIYALDVLYILNRINLNEEKEVIEYVKRN